MPLRYIVPDTCAIAASLYNETHSPATDLMLQEIRQRTVDAVAPSLGLAEFLNVSRRKLADPALSQAAVDTAVADFMSLPITWIDVESFAAEAWRLHRTYGVETGDAFFLRSPSRSRLKSGQSTLILRPQLNPYTRTFTT